MFQITEMEISHQECGFCQRTGTDLKRCLACKNIWYCNVQCQRTDWSSHKENCAIVRVYPKTAPTHGAISELTGEAINHHNEPDQYLGKRVDMILKIQTMYGMDSAGREVPLRMLWVYDKSREYQVNIFGAEGYDENYDAISEKIITDGLPCVKQHPLLKKLYFKARLHPDSSLDVYLNCTYNDQNW